MGEDASRCGVVCSPEARMRIVSSLAIGLLIGAALECAQGEPLESTHGTGGAGTSGSAGDGGTSATGGSQSTGGADNSGSTGATGGVGGGGTGGVGGGGTGG